MKANTRHDEFCFVVPRLLLHTPIAYNDIPTIIDRAHASFREWLNTRPNLEEDTAHAVKLYHLRMSRHISSQESLDINSMVFT
jgi:hypothetical protein